MRRKNQRPQERELLKDVLTEKEMIEGSSAGKTAEQQICKL